MLISCSFCCFFSLPLIHEIKQVNIMNTMMHFNGLVLVEFLLLFFFRRMCFLLPSVSVNGSGMSCWERRRKRRHQQNRRGLASYSIVHRASYTHMLCRSLSYSNLNG